MRFKPGQFIYALVDGISDADSIDKIRAINTEHVVVKTKRGDLLAIPTHDVHLADKNTSSQRDSVIACVPSDDWCESQDQAIEASINHEIEWCRQETMKLESVKRTHLKDVDRRRRQ